MYVCILFIHYYVLFMHTYYFLYIYLSPFYIQHQAEIVKKSGKW